MHNKKPYLFLAVGWTLVITILSLITLGSVGESIDVPYKDKIVHYTFYFFFVVFWILFFKTEPISKKTNLIVMFSGIGYGILMEICQGFTDYRTPDMLDVAANSIGSISGLIFTNTFLNKRISHS